MRFVLIAALVLAPSALAQTCDKTFVGVGLPDFWNVASNWSPSGVPSASDRVCIPSGTHCIVDVAATVESVEIELYGKLEIPIFITMTLTNASAEDSLIDGEFVVGDTLLIADDDHTFEGGGRVELVSSSSELQIDSGLTLTSQLDEDGIVGRGAIVGIESMETTGTFHNQGEVRADGGSIGGGATLELASTTILADDSTAQWRAADEAVLKFSRDASLDGHIELRDGSCAKVLIAADLTTCGAFRWSDASILEVESGATFEYASYQSLSNTCSNPKDSGTGGCSTGIFTIAGPATKTCGDCS
ncbi:MAG: G8 domain-containing protein [Phycisphaerales bacterium JB039]